MSAALVEKGFAVVIMDAEKGSMSKLNFEKSKTAIEFAKENLPSWAPTCSRINEWLLGGLSAGVARPMQSLAPILRLRM